MALVVGENLRQLSRHQKICPDEAFDNFSLKLTLSPVIFMAAASDAILDYANSDAIDFYNEGLIPEDGLVLNPGDCVLACSAERVSIPLGFFGTVQTKGSLARIFVSVHQTDCQIEPGFSGSITLELKNHSPHKIRLRRYDNIAQLFLWTCTTDNTPAYSGKYFGSSKPTIKILRRPSDDS